MAQGSIREGDLMLKVGTKKISLSVRKADYSTLILSNIKNKIVSGIKIESLNDALSIKNLSDEMEIMIRSFIRERQLDYFNFRLHTSSDSVWVNIDVAIEEKELWFDYLELIKKIIV